MKKKQPSKGNGVDGWEGLGWYGDDEPAQGESFVYAVFPWKVVWSIVVMLQGSSVVMVRW